MKHAASKAFTSVLTICVAMSIYASAQDSNLDKGSSTSQTNGENLKELYAAAEAGDVDAMYSIASKYLFGNGVSQDEGEALRWARRAADAGSAKAMNRVGNHYVLGQGVGKDLAEALEWFKRAAAAGSAEAMHTIALCYFHGEGVVQDKKEALKWHIRAAEAGNADAMLSIGNMYYQGKGVVSDDAEALRWFERAAKGGLADAMFNIAVVYSKKGAMENLDESGRWLKKAAQHGSKYAKAVLRAFDLDQHGRLETLLGYDLFKRGQYEGSIDAFRESAEAGDAEAQYWLGVAYATGMGVPQDQNAATEWYKKSAQNGDSKATYNLGKRFFYALGVEKNVETFASLVREAAEKGHAEAQALHAENLLEGRGVPQSIEESSSWKQRAKDNGFDGSLASSYRRSFPLMDNAEKNYVMRGYAEAGDKIAMNNLGLRYWHGDIGFPADETEAYKWFVLEKTEATPLTPDLIREAIEKTLLPKRDPVALKDVLTQVQIEYILESCNGWSPKSVFRGK